MYRSSTVNEKDDYDLKKSHSLEINFPHFYHLSLIRSGRLCDCCTGKIMAASFITLTQYSTAHIKYWTYSIECVTTHRERMTRKQYHSTANKGNRNSTMLYTKYHHTMRLMMSSSLYPFLRPNK